MKKELILMLTAAALGTVCFSSISAEKAYAKTSGDYKYVVTGKKKKTCAIRKYLGKDADVTVPAKLDGYSVTRIGNNAFSGNKKIKTVTLPKDITIIGERAFAGCSKLKDINIPDKVHTIRKEAFASCKQLKDIKLSVRLKTIGKGAFRSCPLSGINIPQNVETIGDDAFSSALNSISVDKNNKHFDSRDNCSALIRTSDNTILKGSNKSVIPASVTAIGNGAFAGCSMKEISIPGTVKTIGTAAFNGCKKLEKADISEGVRSIEKNAFYGCITLKDIKLPDSIEEIGTSAFFECSSVLKINIPKSLKRSHLPGIFDCISTAAITVSEGNPFYDSRDNCNAVIESDSNTLVLGCKNSVIPGTVKTIGEAPFFSSPSELVIPEGVEALADCAFASQTNLKKITLPSSLKKIGAAAFSNCSHLKEIVIPEGITIIESDTFEQCDELQKITFPDSLETIMGSAFTGCYSISELYLPKNLKDVDIKETFNFCEFNKISVAPENPYFDSRDNCNAVIEKSTDTLLLASNTATIPASVKAIGEEAFCDLEGISEIYIPDSVKTIGNYAFGDCSNLKKIRFPSGMTSIPEGMLDNCDSITEITIPVSLTSIEDDFLWSNLKKINYAGSEDQLKKIKVDHMTEGEDDSYDVETDTIGKIKAGCGKTFICNYKG